METDSKASTSIDPPPQQPNSLHVPFYRNKFFLGFVGASFLAAFLIGGIAIGKDQASKSSTSPTAAKPTPTCIPRPPCLDSEPACKVVETSDMCTKDETAYWKIYSGNVFSLKYPPSWFLSPGTQSVTLSNKEITKDSNQVVQVSFFEDEVPTGLTSSTRVYIKNPNGGYVAFENQGGDRKTFNQIISTFKFKSPKPTCTPRPSCLDNPLSMCDPKEPAGGWCPK